MGNGFKHYAFYLLYSVLSLIGFEAIIPPDALHSLRLHFGTANTSFMGNGFFKHYAFYLLYPVLSLIGFEAIISPDAVHSRRVPSLGGYADIRASTERLIGCISGILFGAIHCMGWNFLFDGQTEWRIACLAMVFAPPYTLVLYRYGFSGNGADVIGRFTLYTTAISCAIYIVVRVALIVLMLMSLRSLPPGAYDTVAWSTFIPHY